MAAEVVVKTRSREAIIREARGGLRWTSGPKPGRRIRLEERSAVLNTIDQKKKNKARAETIDLFVGMSVQASEGEEGAADV